MAARMARAIRSEITGSDVEILPALAIDEDQFVTIAAYLDEALQQLAHAGVLPIRIVHGDRLDEDAAPATQAEVVDRARRGAYAKCAADLERAAQLHQQNGRDQAAAALALAALEIRSIQGV